MGRKLNTLTTDYDTIRTQLINILQDFNLIKDLHKSSTGVIIIEQLAYVVELLNFYINEARNEMSVPDAQKRSSLIELAKSFGYDLFYGAPSRGDIYITYSHADYAGGVGNYINIPQYTYIQSRGGVNYMTIEDYNFGETTGAGYLRVRQGILKTAVLGNSDGKPFQKFRIPSRYVTIPTEYDKPLVNVLFEVHVLSPGATDPVTWNFRDSLITSIDTDEHFTVEMDEDNYVYVVFGDDLFGKIPEVGGEIEINYEEHVGSYGNIDGGDISAGNFNVNELAVYNTNQLVEAVSMSAANFTNGRDPDDNATLREHIPTFTRLQGRAVVPQDFEDAWSLHKGVIRSQVIGFNDIYTKVSRYYTISGTATNVSAFTAAGSFRDLSGWYDQPWQYIQPSGSLDDDTVTGMASAFYGDWISGFGIAQTDIWAYNAAGVDLVYQPDFQLYVCAAVGSDAPTASTIASGWFDKIIWSDDVIGASSVGHSGGAIQADTFTTPLQEWLDQVAQPMINLNFQQKIPRWVWVNLVLNVEKDPKYTGANSTITGNIAQLMWDMWGFKSICPLDNQFCVQFGRKTYLNRIENSILNNIDGIVSVNIGGDPAYLLPATALPGAAGEITGSVAGGLGFDLYVVDASGTMFQAIAQEYLGNWPATAASATVSAACYTSAYGVFWNPEERSLKFKENQIPIFNISAINFT